MITTKPRTQCAKCPWRKGTNPRRIPRGYSAKKHRTLVSTIAEPGVLPTGNLHLMACHDSPRGAELPCVGWLVHQLGVGNNIGLRLAVLGGRVSADVETVGPQHDCFKYTLPRSCEIKAKQ